MLQGLCVTRMHLRVSLRQATPLCFSVQDSDCHKCLQRMMAARHAAPALSLSQAFGVLSLGICPLGFLLRWLSTSFPSQSAKAHLLPPPWLCHLPPRNGYSPTRCNPYIIPPLNLIVAPEQCDCCPEPQSKCLLI